MQKERIEYFDIAKGIAILLVILGHCFQNSLYTPNNEVYIYKNSIMSIIASVHMPVFIFISGIFSKKNYDYKEYWIKKTKQLILPLFFIPILYCLVFSKQFHNLVYNPYHLGYWFTWALFLMYIPFFIVRKISEYIKSKYKDCIELILFGISYVIIKGIHIILISQNNFDTIGLLSLNSISWLYPYLILGYLFYSNDFVKRFFTNEVVICISFILYSLYMATLFNFDEFQLIKNLPIEICGVICFLSIARYIESKRSKVSNFLSYLGKISLPIYFLHYFFVPDITRFIPELSNISSRETLVIVFLGFLITAIVLFFTLITYNIICSNRCLHKLLFGTDIPK